ncbi:MAG TPA: hypothetical protein VLA19_29120 [Herpetosiphonaceae bacterium]|nr:hypothetical protein [Herpetosiphonaceae bacterium]
MILGRGTAQTDDAIGAEYAQFLADANYAPKVYHDLVQVPALLQRRIGKPIAAWTPEDILGLFEQRGYASRYRYLAFLTFLWYRGYHRPTLDLLTRLPSSIARLHLPALAPLRQRLRETREGLRYRPSDSRTTSNVRLLAWLLAVVQKPLEELTRADFEGFREEYQAWYRTTVRLATGKGDPSLAQVERCLIVWGTLRPRRKGYCHEEYFAQLRHPRIREAVVQ